MKGTTRAKIFVPLSFFLFFSCDTGGKDLDDFLEFQRSMTPVETESELLAAIKDTSVSVIGIVGNLNVMLTEPLEITRPLTITSFSGATTLSPGSLPVNDPFFAIKPNCSLTLGDPRSNGTLILDGKKDNGARQAPLIQAERFVPGSANSRFTMYDGVVLTNNINNTTNANNRGGGVYVAPGSSFTMHGGIISENSAGNAANGFGGGVYLAPGAISFTMYGGTISNNTAQTNGGGVYLDLSVSFTMQAPAIIIGNTAVSSFGGGGVYVLAGATFNKGTGIVSGNWAPAPGSPNNIENP